MERWTIRLKSSNEGGVVGDEESCWGGDEVYDVEGGGMFSGGHVMTWVDNLVKAEVLVDK